MTNHRGVRLRAELQTDSLLHCKSGPQRVVFSLKQRALVYQMVSESRIKPLSVNLGSVLFAHGDELARSEPLQDVELSKVLVSKSKHASGAPEDCVQTFSDLFNHITFESQSFCSNAEKLLITIRSQIEELAVLVNKIESGTINKV